jgi:hypothetical protein
MSLRFDIDVADPRDWAPPKMPSSELQPIVAGAVVVVDPEAPTDAEMRWALGLNMVAIAVHVGMALTFAIGGDAIFDWRYRITKSGFVRTGGTGPGDSAVFEERSESLWEGAFWVFPVVFHSVTVVSHALYVWGHYDGWLRRMLTRRYNPLQWVEYSVSASVMLTGISVLSMVSSYQTLLLVYVAIATTMGSGVLVEMRPDRVARVAAGLRLRWSPYGMLAFAHTMPLFIAAWVPAYAQFIENADDAPGFVWAIMIGIFLFFNTFPINMWLVESGRYRYPTAYLVYLVLSLTSKTLLGGLIAGGGTRDDEPPQLG